MLLPATAVPLEGPSITMPPVLSAPVFAPLPLMTLPSPAPAPPMSVLLAKLRTPQ